MAIKSLAVKYRPITFDDVVEQESIKVILKQQLDADETKNAYLFCGGAGTGKTTCARIFANEINKHQGNPIEMDAASNSSVEDVREIITQAKTKSLDSEYKVFIIDECHAISSTGWQAFLKLIEEPPAKSIFIFCTTDPQKIPKTILSRVQRYDFQRIGHNNIVKRLTYIVNKEQNVANDFHVVEPEALDYIAKLSEGGMRDAITLMDKCLAYSADLTIENVLKALGTVDYITMIDLASAIIQKDSGKVVSLIEDVHRSGKDLKQFVKTFMKFMLDVNKYCCLKSFELLDIPIVYINDIEKLSSDMVSCNKLLCILIKLNSEIKWETMPKALIEATLLLHCTEENKND